MRSHKRVQEFLEDVNEQIRYRPMCTAIDEELVAHIEDKAELYKEYGVEEEEAILRAVRDMGDATEIGLQMNAVHHTRICCPLFGMALAFIVLGVLGNLRDSLRFSSDLQAVAEGLWDSKYFLAGAVVLIVVMQYGYPFIIRHVKKICIGYFVFSGMVLIWDSASVSLHNLFVNASVAFPFWLLPSPTIHFGMLLLAAPVFAVVAYRQRHKAVKGLWVTALFVFVVMVSQGVSMYGNYIYMAVLALLLTFLIVLFYMCRKDYLDLPKKKACGWVLALFLILLCSFGVGESTGRAGYSTDGKTSLYRTMELFLTPERQATSTWQDGYNAVLIKELLRQADVIGEIKLSQQELFDYATGAWYYGENPVDLNSLLYAFEKNMEYLLQFLDSENVTLEDVLPQSYHNNYRIAYWILKYGWLSGLLLMGAIAVFCVLLVRVSFRIRNRLGRLVAFAGSTCLLIQYIFYVLGNFGHQFAWFGNLPFLSEGIVSIGVNGILLGLVLSAHRYDLVMEEKLEN